MASTAGTSPIQPHSSDGPESDGHPSGGTVREVPATKKPATSVHRLGVAAVVVTVVLWASAFVGIRAVGPSFSPGALTLGRLAVAAVVLGSVVLPETAGAAPGPRVVADPGLRRYVVRRLQRGPQRRRALLDAGTSALLINVNPILVAVMAGIILKEGFPRWLIIGSLVAFGGVAVIALGSGQRSTADVAGVLLCLLAAALAAVSVIVQKPVLRKFPAAQATWFGIMVGLVCCLPFAASWGRNCRPPRCPPPLAWSTWASSPLPSLSPPGPTPFR